MFCRATASTLKNTDISHILTQDSLELRIVAVDSSREARRRTLSSGLFVRLLFPRSRMNFHTCSETCVKHFQAAAVTNLLCLLHNKVGEHSVAITETARGPNYINGTQAVTEQRNTLCKHVVILLCWLHLYQLISVKPKRPGQPSRLLFRLNRSLQTDGGHL